MLNATPDWRAGLQSPLARMRLSRERACLERMGGTVEGYAGSVPHGPARPVAGEAAAPREMRTLDVAVFAARARYSLRCSLR
jgi:hypothetical protein